MSRESTPIRKRHPNLRRRTFFTPLLMPVLVAAAALLVLGWFYAGNTTTTVLLVRHAEKLADQGDDPALDPAGLARANRLAAMLAETQVDGLFASEFKRTQMTLQPLSERTGIEIVVVPAADPQRLVDRVNSDYRGGTVVIAGHSNTLPELIAHFSGMETEAIDESDYRGIYVLSLPRYGENTLLKLQYPR